MTVTLNIPLPHKEKHNLELLTSQTFRYTHQGKLRVGKQAQLFTEWREKKLEHNMSGNQTGDAAMGSCVNSLKRHSR